MHAVDDMHQSQWITKTGIQSRRNDVEHTSSTNWTCTAMSPENQVMEVPFSLCWPTPYLVGHLPSLMSGTSHLSCRAPPISLVGHLPSLVSGTSCLSHRAPHVSRIGQLTSLVSGTITSLVSGTSCLWFRSPHVSGVGHLVSGTSRL